MPFSSFSQKIRLHRNSRRGRVAGICAGIADLLNINVFWIRAIWLFSMFISMGLTVAAYLVMWLLVPAKPTLPIPRVDREFVRELKKMDRLVKRCHRELDHTVADKAEDTFDAMKMLAGKFESSKHSSKNLYTVWNATKQTFHDLLKNLLYAEKMDDNEMLKTKLKKMEELRHFILQSGEQAFNSEIQKKNDPTKKKSAEWRAWKDKINPTLMRIRQRAGPQVLTVLEKIEQKLAYLMDVNEDEADNSVFDLSRFEISQIANQYLPDALEEYLKLPAHLARTQRLNNDFTAEESLAEQLIRLDHVLEELSSSYFEKDAQGLLVHGRFLKDKFSQQAFNIDAA